MIVEGGAVYMWVCNKGHRSLHSDDEIKSTIIFPRCGLLINGSVCTAELSKRLFLAWSDNDE